MASYAETSEDTPVDRAKRTLAFASATSSEAPTPAGPPLSPYRDPSANCDPSEAPTPVRERRRESPPPDEPENAEEESLRLALLPSLTRRPSPTPLPSHQSLSLSQLGQFCKSGHVKG